MDNGRLSVTVGGTASRRRPAAVASALQSASSRLGEIVGELRTEGDRSDPRVETLLCLVECAEEAAVALSTSLSQPPDECEDRLRQSLGAARAAVLCASMALTESRETSAVQDESVSGGTKGASG